MNEIVICSFYKFIELLDFEQLRGPILAQMHEIGIKGTIILAQEGLNGGFAGVREQMELFYDYMRKDLHFTDLKFKETFDEKNPFEKSKVKLRKELVSLGLPTVVPLDRQETHLSPKQWNTLIQDPDVLLIDTRNNYEYELGTFRDAINPNLEHFRAFPEYVQRNLSDKKDKKIAMFCTGGIRCEKTTAFMKEQGFQNVYQLQDGILNYIKAIPPGKSLWEGQCFVFDNRVAVDQQLQRVYPQLPEDYKHRRSKE